MHDALSLFSHGPLLTMTRNLQYMHSSQFSISFIFLLVLWTKVHDINYFFLRLIFLAWPIFYLHCHRNSWPIIRPYSLHTAWIRILWTQSPEAMFYWLRDHYCLPSWSCFCLSGYISGSLFRDSFHGQMVSTPLYLPCYENWDLILMIRQWLV